MARPKYRIGDQAHYFGHLVVITAVDKGDRFDEPKYNVTYPDSRDDSGLAIREARIMMYATHRQVTGYGATGAWQYTAPVAANENEPWQPCDPPSGEVAARLRRMWTYTDQGIRWQFWFDPQDQAGR